MILLDPTNLVATIRDSLRCQLEHKLGVLLTDRQADDIARNVAQAVHGLEVDETHVVSAPVHIHAISPDPSNGGQYSCSCGIRWMSLAQADEHRRMTTTIDTRSLLSKRDRHHDRCMSPFDDGHLTCPVVGGR